VLGREFFAGPGTTPCFYAPVKWSPTFASSKVFAGCL
jgi:hypothetical protein